MTKTKRKIWTMAEKMELRELTASNCRGSSTKMSRKVKGMTKSKKRMRSCRVLARQTTSSNSSSNTNSSNFCYSSSMLKSNRSSMQTQSQSARMRTKKKRREMRIKKRMRKKRETVSNSKFKKIRRMIWKMTT